MRYILPSWFDKFIYEELDGIYSPSPDKVKRNADKNFDFSRVYLGTYSPRSWAEMIDFLCSLVKLPKAKACLESKTEISVMDFCCGFGGEIFGLVMMINKFFPNIKRITVNAYDANNHYLRGLYGLYERVVASGKLRVELHVKPQCLYIENIQNVEDIMNHAGYGDDFIISSKAINEFVQSGCLGNDNAYELISAYLMERLADDGFLIISDITSISPNGRFYPLVMNSGINEALKKTDNMFKTIIPTSCYYRDPGCNACFMQKIVRVSHSQCKDDISKIAYRVICHSEFADDIMEGVKPAVCASVNQMCVSDSPYLF